MVEKTVPKTMHDGIRIEAADADGEVQAIMDGKVMILDNEVPSELEESKMTLPAIKVKH